MRFVILNPDADVASNPTLSSLLKRLEGDGFELDLVESTTPRSTQLGTKEGGIARHPYPHGNGTRALRARANVWRLISRSSTGAVLAVNPRGIGDAFRPCSLSGKPLVYLSFELLFRDELPRSQGWKRSWTRLKNGEIKGSRQAEVVLIQDPVRGRLLQEENGLDAGRFIFLPVAPATAPPLPASPPDRARFGLPKDKTIVLHSGSFGEWTHAGELIANVDSWPDEFLLVVHLRSPPNAEVTRLIEGCKSRKVLFSTHPLDERAYLDLICCADIGLALYKPGNESPWTGRNIAAMGMASGKFASYMKAGLPTVTLRMPFHRAVLEEYGFGLDIDEFRELPDALTAIRRAPSPYRSEARRWFEERLNFDLHYPELKRRLLALANRPNEDRR